MAKLRMAHASTHGARKPPGPIVNNAGFIHFLQIEGEKNTYFTYILKRDIKIEDIISHCIWLDFVG